MCGICGVMSTEGMLDPRVRDALPRMTATLAHRGPDGEDFYFDDRVGLGHRRLSIIDIAGGAQPMSNEDGTVWTVFNGEIYNHRELRKELLARGHRFRSECDTEVIVHAFEEYGSGCVERFAGMFAFAVYDQKTGELLLARDRLGKKPLFYARFGDTLHFASEIKALKESPLWAGDWNREALEEYFSLGYIMAPRTIYRQVNKLEAGSHLVFRNGEARVDRYWDISQFDTDGRSEPDLLDELQSLLGEAVGCRLESEVPLGAFLSGGIDSGLVVSYMSEMGDRAPTTCSVGFADTAHNELEAAARAAAKYRTDPSQSRLDGGPERGHGERGHRLRRAVCRLFGLPDVLFVQDCSAARHGLSERRWGGRDLWRLRLPLYPARSRKPGQAAGPRKSRSASTALARGPMAALAAPTSLPAVGNLPDQPWLGRRHRLLPRPLLPQASRRGCSARPWRSNRSPKQPGVRSGDGAVPELSLQEPVAESAVRRSSRSIFRTMCW